MRLGLQKKLTLLLLLCSLIPFLALGAWVTMVNWKTETDEYKREGDYALRSVENNINTMKTQVESFTRAFVNDSALLSALSPASTRAQKTIAFMGDVIDEIVKIQNYLSFLPARIMIIYEDDGVMTEHWYKLLRSSRFGRDAAYVGFRESGKSYMWHEPCAFLPESLSDIYEFDTLGDMLLYQQLIIDGMGRELGTVRMGVELTSLNSVAVAGAPGWDIYIYSKDALAYMSPGSPTVAPPVGGAEDFYQGGLWRSREIPDMGLTVYARISESEITDKFIRERALTAALIVAAMTAMLFMSRRVLSGVLDRLKRTARVAESIDETAYSVRLPEEGSDEVGTMVKAYNKLLARLDKQRDELIEKERVKRRVQTMALQYQLNPHFLFNSLQWLQMEAESQGADEMMQNSIAELGTVLHYNLSDSHTATLIDEAAQMRAYVNFMRAMKRCDIELLTEWSDDLNEARILRFTLQPLLENAIRHGLVKDRPLTLNVTAVSEGDFMRVRVQNDGKPMDADALSRARRLFEGERAEDGKSVGLTNLAARLKLSYGENVSVKIDSDENCTSFDMLIPKNFEMPSDGGADA